MLRYTTTCFFQSAKKHEIHWCMSPCVANEGLVLYIGGDYGLHLNVVLLVQYVSRRVVMVSSWGDVWRRTIRAGRNPLIGVERRKFRPRQGTSWRGEPRRLESQLALGHGTRSTTQRYTSDTVKDRTCSLRIEERTCEYIMWCQPNGHDTVWLITRTLMLRLMGC